MRKVSVVFAAFVIISASAQPKPAWKWTDQERLDERFHPGAAAVRAAVMEECASDRERCTRTSTVYGKYNPELFLPNELMLHLTLAYRPDKMKAKRALWTARAASLQPGEDFWERLYAVAGMYIDAEVKQYQAMMQRRQLPEPELDRLRELSGNRDFPLCALRVQALQAARAAFGRDWFDRFLHEVVGPDVHIAISSSGGAKGAREHVAWQERRCP